MNPPLRLLREKICVIFAKSFIRACRGRLFWWPAVLRNNFPIYFISPNEPTTRTGRTRRRGTGFTSRPRAAGTLRRTVRSSFPHRATARWGPHAARPSNSDSASPKRLRLRRVFPMWAAVGGGPYNIWGSLSVIRWAAVGGGPYGVVGWPFRNSIHGPAGCPARTEHFV